MSILNRPGWANRQVITEGRVYQDELKKRILSLFDRPSLGRSPNYVVDNIYNSILASHGQGEEMIDTNSINDEDIIKITIDTANHISRGQCVPKLKIEISTNSEDEIEEQEPEAAMMYGSEQSVEPEESETHEYEENEPYEAIEHEDENEFDEVADEDDQSETDYDESDESDEDAEQVETCGCEKHQSLGSVGAPNVEPKHKKIEHKKVTHHESAKLSSKAVNQLLQESYIKTRQHKFRMEERFR
jgi:hypothetical protein